jgi:hypothetical protein
MRFIILSVLLGLFSSTVIAEPRLALVIGNSDYLDFPLTNPVNDAVDMKEVLEKYKFTVLSPVLNGSRQAMEDAIRSFAEEITDRGIALFYYSGHGVEVGGKNYMLPVDHKFYDAADVKDHALSVNWVLDEMRASGAKINIVILDACLEEKKGTGKAGFASMDARGTIISYATTPGKNSLGAKGLRNSIYTGSLLKVLRGDSGHLPIEQVFKNAGTAVVKRTDFLQEPTIVTGLTGENFCFGRCDSVSKPSPPIAIMPTPGSSLYGKDPSPPSSVCDTYAKTAVGQYQKNFQKGCGFCGTSWTSDYSVHFDWCMETASVGWIRR